MPANGATVTEHLEESRQEQSENATAGPAGWYALWTRSHCEQLVFDQLAAKGFRPFLPEIEAWTTRGGLRRLSRIPMFPGYLVLLHALDKGSYIEVRRREASSASSGNDGTGWPSFPNARSKCFGGS